MKNQSIKVIKRNDEESKSPPAPKKKPKKVRTIESTIEGWISERRDNEDIEDRARNSEFNSWHTDTPPTEAP